MDILGDVFSTLRLRGALYFRTDLSGPFAVKVPELGRAARFHLVVQGVCLVRVGSGETVTLHAGDLILVPAGRDHTLSDAPCDAAPDLETVLSDAGYDGRGVLTVGDGDPAAATQMVCGHLTFRDGADHPLLRALPDSLVTRSADRAKEPWLDEILRLITRRIFLPTPGSEAAVIRLSEALFIELIRFSAQQHPAMASLIAAVEDPQIGRSLTAIHERADANWTVQSLAAEAGMSRSRFAERFRTLIGMSPMGYLSEWRLQKALAMLDESRCSVQQVAARTGYQSPAAFTRAFAAKFGAPPSEYRRQIA